MKSVSFDNLGLEIPEFEEKKDENGIIDDSKISTTNFVKQYNKKKGNLQKYDCQKCKNKGTIADINIDFDEEEKIRYWKPVIYKCECMELRKTIDLAEKSGLGKYLKWRLKDYITTEEWQVKLKEKTREFLENHCSKEDTTWFCLLGQCGSGKSLLASVVANHLMYNEHRNLRYIIWTDFIAKLKRDVSGTEESKLEVNEYMEDIKKADVLYIDEMLKIYNQTDIKYIAEIINYRYSNNLKTIITSEHLLIDLLKMDEATFSRLFEMCIGKKYILQVEKDLHKNYRLKMEDE